MQHINDPFVKMATQKGYRARAAFKLTEILDAEKLMRRGDVIVDLGSTPGSWSQVARERLVGKGGVLDGRIVALDILPMEPIAGVEFILGDFSEDSVLEQLNQTLEGTKVDLVMSDMAPNMSGNKGVDMPRAIYLGELALETARVVLSKDGCFLVKLFHGEGFESFYQDVQQSFSKVVIRKPKASRPRSNEVYILAKGFKS